MVAEMVAETEVWMVELLVALKAAKMVVYLVMIKVAMKVE